MFMRKIYIKLFLFLSLFYSYSEAKIFDYKKKGVDNSQNVTSGMKRFPFDKLMSLASSVEEDLSNETDYSVLEQTVLERDQIDLANLMRTLRLLNPHPKKSLHWSIWNEQTQLNVPILILGSLALNTTCQEKGKNSLLFSARGCCHFIKIFKKLFPSYQSTYLHSSRYMYTHPTPKYVRYFKSLYSSKTLIVDEIGSGTTCKTFFKQFFSSDPCYFPLVGAHGRIESITHSFNAHIEMINYDLVGSLISYNKRGPVRLPPEYKIEDVQVAHDCIAKCVQLLEHYTFDTFDSELLRGLFAVLQFHQPALSPYHNYKHNVETQKN